MGWRTETVTFLIQDEILELRRLLDEKFDQEDASKERLTRLERDVAEMKELLRRFTARSQKGTPPTQLTIGHIHGAGLPGLSRSVWHAKKDHRAACYDKPL